MARIQAVLGLIGFSSTSNNPSTTPRILSVQLKDAANGSSVAVTRTVGLKAVNDAPVIGGLSSPLTYNRNTTAIAIAPNGLVTDSDSPNLKVVRSQSSPPVPTLRPTDWKSRGSFRSTQAANWL